MHPCLRIKFKPLWLRTPSCQSDDAASQFVLSVCPTTLDGFNTIPWEHLEGGSVKDCFRKELHFPFLNRMLSKLKKQFTDQACEVMPNAAAFRPQCMSHQECQKLKALQTIIALISIKLDSDISYFYGRTMTNLSSIQKIDRN